MRVSLCLGLYLILLGGCSTLTARKQEKAAAYASLSEAARELVDQRRIQRGMDTNAVYIAWGKPSVVRTQPPATNSGSDQVWIYNGNRPVLVPRWVYLPSAYGRGTLHYSPTHHSERYTKAVVFFRNDQVVTWRKPWLATLTGLEPVLPP